MMWWGIVAEYSKPFHELFEGGSILLFKKKDLVKLGANTCPNAKYVLYF